MTVVETGTTFAGRYRLGSIIGRGGMSDVWEATDLASGQAVALKVVRSDDPGLAARLAREARTVAGLSHPGLVQVLDAGGDGAGHAYVAMRLVRGQTLQAAMRHGPLGPARTAAMGAEVSDALAYVHAAGVVHRDVKPSNVLLGPDGRSYLTDFGIARVGDTSDLTATGTTVGTVGYMAPEQLESGRVGPAADVWALGIVLLECLSGTRVYDGTPGEVIARRLAGPVPIPDDLPAVWRLALTGMLDHRPARRLSASDVSDLLRTDAVSSPATAAVPAGLAATVAGADLTALAPTAAATEVDRPAGHRPTAVLAGAAAAGAGATEVLGGARPRPRPAPLPPRRDRRRLLAAAIGALAILALLVATLAGGGHNSPSRAATPATTVARPTTPPTTAPPTTAPTPARSLATLLGDLSAGAGTGAVPADVARQAGQLAQQAVVAAGQGGTSAATADLQRAASLVTSGGVASTSATALQADLAALAGTLGLPASAATPTTAPAPAPSKGNNGNGNGDGGDNH